MWLNELLNRLKQLPLWAYGLECAICQKSFKDPEAHYDHVKKSELSSVLHENRVPILK